MNAHSHAGPRPATVRRAERFLGAFAKPKQPLLFFAATTTALLGLALRVFLLLVSGNRPVGPLSGVGDQLRYETLAESIFQGRGMTYADQPTALRPPLYPLLLAGAHVLFGPHYLLAMRVVQFFCGLALAYVCGLLASELFGPEAGTIGAALALALPSLVLISAELQTEQLATLAAGIFVYYSARELRGKGGAAGMGVASGIATLLRFNCALLPPIGLAICLWYRRSAKHAAVLAAVAGALIAPWLVRNAIVFHGRILFSSHGGINLVEGVLTPDGRAQGEDTERVRGVLGWVHTDIEQNSSHRLDFGSEVELDRQARAAAFAAWRSLGWKGLLQILGKKVLTFWLSTDQLLDTTSFPAAQRVLRATGVLVYWAVLALAGIGWWKLRGSFGEGAQAILFYALLVTAAHLPFVMNTRLRIPFLDPLLAALAAGGISFVVFLRGAAVERPGTASVAADPRPAPPAKLGGRENN